MKKSILILFLASTTFSYAGGCKSAKSVQGGSAGGNEPVPERFAEILVRLNAGAGSGRQSGTVPYASAVNYIVSRFQAARLQPGLSSGFDATFYAERNIVKVTSLSFAGRDSLRMLSGIDYVADGRTGTNNVTFSSFVTGPPRQIREGLAGAVVLSASSATLENLRALRANGYYAVLLVGSLGYKTPRTAIPDLSVVRVTRRGLGMLMNLSDAGVSSILNSPTPRVFNLPTGVTLVTEAIYQGSALESNLIAIVSGRYPSRNSKLVVVAAQLDSGGRHGNIDTFNFGDMGIGPAVVVDVATRVAHDIEYSSRPTPSFMFVLTGGSPVTLDGFQSFLNNSIWSRSDILEVIVVGSPEETGNTMVELGDRHKVRVSLLPLDIPANFVRGGFIAKPSDLARAGGRANESIRFENRERREAHEAAALEAHRLSQLVMDRISQIKENPVRQLP